MPHTSNSRNLLGLVRCVMKNTTLNRRTFKLIAVALLTLLCTGCAVAPQAENPSMAIASAHTRAGFPDDLQPDAWTGGGL